MSTPSHHNRDRTRTPSARGQAFVEFALLLLPLLLLVVLTVDLGRVFFGSVALNNAARIAANFASERSEAWPADNPFEVQAQARYRDVVQNDLNSINCDPPSGNADWAEADVPNPTFPEGKDYGDPAVVTLECRFTLVTPLAQAILGGPVTVNAESIFAIHQGNVLALPTPLPTPTPTPVPTPTGTASPLTCTVPPTQGGRANDAQNLWDAEGFTPGNLIRNGSGNFIVDSQSLTPNATVPCSSQMTITEAGQPTPTPTPVPTATPIPTATPVPTVTPVPTPTCETPTASFTADPTSGTSPLTVSFTDTSTARGCPITAWTWNFGDATPTETTQNATHTFTFTGNGNNRNYTVTLTVSSAAGPSISTTTITVRKP